MGLRLTFFVNRLKQKKVLSSNETSETWHMLLKEIVNEHRTVVFPVKEPLWKALT